MKAMFILHSLANFAGVERVMSGKINYLASQGHDICLVTYEQCSHPIVYPLEQSVRHVDLDCRFFTLFRYPMYIRVLKFCAMKRLFRERLGNEIAQFQPDVVVFPTNANDFLQEMVTIYPSVPRIVESHGTFNKLIKKTSLKERIVGLIRMKYVKKCSLLVTLTNSDAKCWMKHLSNVKVIPNPITTYCVELNAMTKKEMRIISVGRLDKLKRFDRLLVAFSLIARKYPTWHLDIFGEGDERVSLELLVKSLKLDCLVTIHTPSNHIMDEYMRSQFLVMSSDSEGFGMVLIEAMSCGIPVVSTNCEFGPSEIVDEGITGLLAECNARDLANKMDWMMSHDNERREMGRKAHSAMAKYRKEIVMKQWEEAYLSVIR